ncbi:MAG: alpha/beta hydrolase [Chlorobiaceae bacterium]|jgi:3-oxoadipate enol-lactonase|nr:alpha/beta hydrolase [Chlorobiaceae bacterium]
MGIAKVNGINLSYDISGSGEPLLLIGGFGMTKEFWNMLVHPLSSCFQVIAYDNRGAGGSTVSTAPYTIEDMAGDAVGLIDALHMDSTHVFGVSMGGMIAQVLCANHPERIGKAILGCTSQGGIHAVSPASCITEAFGQAANPDLTPEEAARLIVPYLFSDTFINREKERVEAFIRLSVDHCMTPEGAGTQMHALARFNAEALPEKIHMPVLVVTGSDDLLIPPENSRILASRIPQASLEIIDGAGHNFFFEKPETTAGLVIEYLLERSQLSGDEKSSSGNGELTEIK